MYYGNKVVKKNKIKIAFLGDLHNGSNNFARKEFKKAIKKVKDDCNFIWFMGDLIEAINHNDERFLSSNREFDITKQITDTIDLLKPLDKNKFLPLVYGNHEEKLLRQTEIDVLKIIAKTLFIDVGGITNIIRFTRNDKFLDIFATHGVGSANKEIGRFKKMFNLMNVVDAEVYVCGHYHDILWCDERTRKLICGLPFTKSRMVYSYDDTDKKHVNGYLSIVKSDNFPYFIMGSSFYKTFIYNEMSYAEKLLNEPLPIGFTILEIDFSKDGSEIDYRKPKVNIEEVFY